MRSYGKCLIGLALVILLCVSMMTGIVLPVSATDATEKIKNVSVLGTNVAHYNTSVGEYPPAMLVDGIVGSNSNFWSGKATEAYLTLDLGAKISLDKLLVYARTNSQNMCDRNIKDYELWVSDTAPVYTATDGTVPSGLAETPTAEGRMARCILNEQHYGTIEFPDSCVGRYVTVHIKNIYREAENQTIDIQEIEVYGTVVEETALAQVDVLSADADNSHYAYPASMLIDGQGSTNHTHWSSKASSTSAVITATLAEAKDVCRVTLYPRPTSLGNFPEGVEVLVSQDGETYTSVLTVSGCVAATEDPIHFDFAIQKGVKKVMLNLTRTTAGYIQVQEMEVYKQSTKAEAIASQVKALEVDYENKVLILPTFEGVAAAILSSSNENIVALDGTVNTVVGGTTDVVLRFEDSLGNTADTQPISVFVLGLIQQMATAERAEDITASTELGNRPATSLIVADGPATNGTYGIWWSSAKNENENEILFTLAQAGDVTGIALQPGNNLGYFPQEIEVMISADNSVWTSVLTESGLTATDLNAYLNFYFDVQESVKYIKIITKTNQSYTELGSVKVLVAPVFETAAVAAEKLTVKQVDTAVKFGDVTEQFLTEITASDNESVVAGNGSITLPAEATEVSLTIKVTNRLDETDVATVTRTLNVKTQAMLEVEAVAEDTDLIPWADRDATKITLPEVPAGYSIKIVESDHPDVVDLEGNITRRDTETVGVRLTFEITNNTTGLSANTKALLLPIYKTYVVPTMTQAQIEQIHQDYESMSYGVFVSYVSAYNYVSATKYRDGKEVTTVTELADAFDVAQFAKDMDDFGAEYVVFTVQHGDDVPLFPSITNRRWREDRRTVAGKPVCSERDVIDELLTALEPYGIDLHLYTRFNGYNHITCAEDKEILGGSDSGIFKTFVWERNYELVERYGDRIAGLWYDGMGSPSMFTMGEERAELTTMLRSFNPAMIITINSGFNDGETNLYSQMNFQDATAWEVNKWVSYREFPVSRHQTASCLASQYWWTRLPQTTTFEKQPLGEMFQYIVGLASISYEGGFLASTGIYAIEPEDHGKENDLWLNGMRDYLVSLNEDYLTPVAESVKNTSVGVAYPTTENITVNTMEWGVSTESRDGKNVYLHVINAPTGSALSLPAPADGSLFAESATILNFDKTITEGVTVTKTADGYDFALPEGKTWDAVDTVIKLERTGYDTTISIYTGDQVFYDPQVKGFADGTVVVREIEGQEYYLIVGTNISGTLTDDCYPVIDGVTQVHFLAKEYQPFHLYLGDYALYGAKAGINPNDENDITKPSAARAADTGETVLVGVDNASPKGQTYIGSKAKVTLDGFTFKGNASLYLGTENTEDKVGESITVNILNCRNSTAEDAYATAPATAFIYGNGAEHKMVSIKNNRFDGVCFGGSSAMALIMIRNWEGVVEGNYISLKNSVTLDNNAAVTNIFWLKGETRSNKDWYGKQNVTIQNNYLAGRVSTSVTPQWYDEYRVHILGNTIAPTVSGYSLINIYTAGSATVDGETKYYSNIDTADIKISGNKVINPEALGLGFVNIYGTITADAADQVAEINAYKAGNIKITHNDIDFGTVSGNAFGGSAVSGYDNLVFDIACNKYGVTVNPVKSGLAVNFAALSDADEAAHKQVEIVEDVAPTLTTEGTGNKICSFCGTVLEENMVLPATGEAIIDTTGYATLEEALQASKAEDVIQLLNDVTAEELMVKNGVTLDLNGKTLTANYLVGFNGAVVVDATDTGTGKLAIAKENLALSKNNPQLPVYDEENGCYLFTRVKNDRFELGSEGGKPKYSTSPMFKDYVHSLMDTADKAAASGVEIIIRLTWSDSDGQYRGQQDYIYYDDSVAQVMASYTNIAGTVNYANQFYGIFVGSEIESGVNVTVSTIVRSSTGVEMESADTALFPLL